MLTLPSTSIDGANIPWIVLVRPSRALKSRQRAEVTSNVERDEIHCAQPASKTWFVLHPTRTTHFRE